MIIPVISVVGRSGSGKTTLICGLLPELKRRGYRIATIKHDVHGFDIDLPGKDSWKHGQAGADLVVISSPFKMAMIEKMPSELPLDQVVNRIKGVDIIICEGYKGNRKPKIEVFRSTVHQQPLCGAEDNLFAFAGDVHPQFDIPVFALNEYSAMADLIEELFLRKAPGTPR